MNKITINRNRWLDAEQLTWLLFALVVVAFYFFALDIPLLGPDEPRYSQVAREMYLRGDWVTPTLGGQNWFEKPVLLYWVQIASYSIFGVSEFAARLGPALFGLGTIGSLFLLGKRVSSFRFQVSGLLGREEITNPEPGTLNSEPGTLNSERPGSLGRWFALIAATSLGLIVFSRGASFDITITFPVTASLVAFYIYDKCSGMSAITRFSSLALFYFFIGVGLLAKGLIGIVFPFAIVAFYLLLSRRWPNREFATSVVWGTLLSFAVAALWYVPMYLKHGWEFIDEFFLQHHFQRFTSNKYRHPGPFWYFWAVLPVMTIPWIPFFIVSVWKYVRRKLFRKSGRDNRDFISEYPDLLRFATAWMLVQLVFFSLSGSKLPGYILPALPAAVVFTALYIREFALKAEWRMFLTGFIAFAKLLAVVLIAAFLLPGFARNDSVKHMIETADRRGFAKAPILNVHTASHNAEFYGAGRLVREENGRLWRFLGVPGVVKYIEENGGAPVLILIPHDFEAQFTTSKLVKTEVLERESELSIISVALPDSGENL